MLRRIKIYTVHIRPEAAMAHEEPVFVREGFNFYAFFFTFLWAFYHRLWLTGFLLFAGAVLLGWLGTHLMTNESLGILQVAYQVIIGFQANDWLRRGLARRGYITHDLTSGESLLSAEQRYFERYISAAT